MEKESENWTYEDFIGFVLLHVAKADFDISVEENRMLEEAIPLQRLRELKRLHHFNSDFDNVQLIMKLGQKYCSKPEEKEQLMKQVMEIIMADNEYNLYEKNVKRSLEILLS